MRCLACGIEMPVVAMYPYRYPLSLEDVYFCRGCWVMMTTGGAKNAAT